MYDNALFFYLLTPPVMALLFCGALAVDNHRRTRKLDKQISAYRAQQAAAQRRRMELFIGEGI